MQQQSLFVKIVIWLMIFLMSAGFAALVISPFASNLSIFGGDSSGRGATQDLVDEGRADVKKDKCADTEPAITGKRLERCKKALLQLASGYQTLTVPEDGATEAPRDAKRNTERAGAAFKQLYELDTKDDENAARYAGWLRDNGKTEQALTIFTALVKRNPNNEDYLLQQSAAQAQANKLDDAIATLRLYIKKFPDSGQLDAVKEQIKTLQDQKKQAAEGGGAAGSPITVG